MASILNASSAMSMANSNREITYDLRTWQGRHDFWDAILNILGGSTNYPGLVASALASSDIVKILYTIDDSEYVSRITGTGQIWIHGPVLSNEPNSLMTLVIIAIAEGYIITMRLVRTESNEFSLVINRAQLTS